MPGIATDWDQYFLRVQKSLHRIEQGDWARPKVSEHGEGYFSIGFVRPSEEEEEATAEDSEVATLASR